MAKTKTISLMKNKKLLFLTVLGVVGATIFAYYTFAGTCVLGTSAGCPLVKYGSRGEAVKVLQKELNATCSHYIPEPDVDALTIDGVFGPKTLTVVKAFQKKYGLAVDGIVGPKTWSRLDYLYDHNRGCYTSGIPYPPTTGP